MVSAHYDRIADQYDDARANLRPREAEYLALTLDPLGDSAATVLDLGCGTGRPIATHIASRGHRLVGVDASRAMLSLARQRLPDHRWIHRRIEDVDFDESFGAVVCWDSLFHLPRRWFEPVIRKIHRWLEPGGRFLLSSGAVVDEEGSGFTDMMFGHEFYYDSLPPDRLRATCEGMGFAVLISEMCEEPEGGRNRGKWATICAKGR